MTTDIIERTLEALVAIVDADAGVQGYTQRSRGSCIPWGSFEASGTIPAERLPVVLYQFAGAFETGGLGDTREVTVRLTAVAEGNGAQSIASALLERVEVSVTEPALSAQGLDAAPLRRNRLTIEPTPEGSRALVRSDLELTLWVTK